MKRFAVLALLTVGVLAGGTGCAPTLRGVVGAGWARSIAAPVDDGGQLFGEMHVEFAGARADPEGCVFGGEALFGGEMLFRGSGTPSDPNRIRMGAEFAPLYVGGGALARCGRMQARLDLQLEPIAAGDYQGAANGDFIQSSAAGRRIGVALDVLAIPTPSVRFGMRLEFDHRDTWDLVGADNAFFLAGIIDWGSRPHGD